MAHILIIDDDAALCRTLARIVTRMGHTVNSTHTLKDGLAQGGAEPPDIVLLDVHLPDANGIEAMNQVHHLPSKPEIIIFTGAGDPDGAELAIKGGAWDYIEKSSSVKAMTLPLMRALEYRSEKCAKIPVFLDRRRIVGNSSKMTACLDLVAQAAAGDTNVLITGETGTGKELFADAIHINSKRADNNFVVVDCAALPHELVESILFGHEKGAFTGAEQSRTGLVKQADGGTLFLDEIGELPLDLQKTFLRVLEEHCFRPVGSQKQISSDFRLVAATNRDLDAMVAAGTFRQDLLFRIRTLVIDLPPLRERARDIRDLAIYFADTICDKTGQAAKRFAEDFFDGLQSYAWPGNVRELLHAMEHALSVAGLEHTIFIRHLPSPIRVYLARQGLKANCNNDRTPIHGCINKPISKVREAAIAEAEKGYLQTLLTAVNGDVQEACRISGLSRSRLYHLMKTYGLQRSN
ncbi:two component system response regulator, sigma54-specific, Fis family [Desulfosarcina variabilis str. Montpellier]|uniref:sigma-54-dependent transcriptional regulator n=1 Tax=Desulfosarcina variabilis TaxID=2300 RepID=UPI003AFAC61F